MISSRLSTVLLITLIFVVGCNSQNMNIVGCRLYSLDFTGCRQCYKSIPAADMKSCISYTSAPNFKSIDYCVAYYSNNLCAKCDTGYFNNSTVCLPNPVPRCAEFEFSRDAFSFQCLQCTASYPDVNTPGAPCGAYKQDDCMFGGWDYTANKVICKRCRGAKQSVNGVCTNQDVSVDGCIFSNGYKCLECDYQAGYYSTIDGRCAWGIVN